MLYRRYVDDVIVVWKTTPNLAQFVEAMNDNPYRLSLEVDQHSNTNVHFLDVNIRIQGPNIHTTVYRKLCASPTYIPSDSCDPFQYKLAAFRSLVRRAYSHSSTQEALREELTHIEKIADMHGYHNIVPRIAERHERALMSHNTPMTTLRNSHSIDMERILLMFNHILISVYTAVAKRRNVNIAYKRGPTIFDILRNGKDPPDPIKSPGIYRIPVRDDRFGRDLVYIGSTKRSMGVRISEHKADIRHNRATTSLSVYASDPDITVDFAGAKLIVKTTQRDHLK
ncbi:uncharacterized protein LOC111614694 [Centruroides sculpturatus]|uniref:uncharacterized protein LOC111614694 n=1 Tax=Centruroides sculpturatus TaxID=218467 RepID=UPI000C6EF86D|nr:uncharacterized protein LOC111614694 [Centruroides sculpturatus]